MLSVENNWPSIQSWEDALTEAEQLLHEQKWIEGYHQWKKKLTPKPGDTLYDPNVNKVLVYTPEEQWYPVSTPFMIDMKAQVLYEAYKHAATGQLELMFAWQEVNDTIHSGDSDE